MTDVRELKYSFKSTVPKLVESNELYRPPRIHPVTNIQSAYNMPNTVLITDTRAGIGQTRSLAHGTCSLKEESQVEIK